MKLSKLTKKLLCTSLVAVGVVTTMSGVAQAMTLSGSIIGTNMPIKNYYFAGSKVAFTENAGFWSDGEKSYYPAANTKIVNHTITKTYSGIKYHEAYNIYNGIVYKVGGTWY